MDWATTNLATKFAIMLRFNLVVVVVDGGRFDPLVRLSCGASRFFLAHRSFCPSISAFFDGTRSVLFVRILWNVSLITWSNDDFRRDLHFQSRPLWMWFWTAFRFSPKPPSIPSLRSFATFSNALFKMQFMYLVLTHKTGHLVTSARRCVAFFSTCSRDIGRLDLGRDPFDERNSSHIACSFAEVSRLFTI